MDAYRRKNSIVLWLKTPENIQIEREFKTEIYLNIQEESTELLRKERMPYIVVQKKTYMREWKSVYSVPVYRLDQYERIVRWIEYKTRHRLPMYNADIAPEQHYLYENDLRPCSAVEISGSRITPLKTDETAVMKVMRVKVISSGDVRQSTEMQVKEIIADRNRYQGKEEVILHEFAEYFKREDPDVVVMQYGFSRLPYLVKRMEGHGIGCPFHRWDPKEIKYKGGKSFYSYGNVRYRDFAVRLNGRFLIDTSSMLASECSVDGIAELSYLSGVRFQQIASRSFGAVFQGSLVRHMIQQGILVPFKEKPVEKPMSMFQLLKSDRSAHTYDPKVGMHHDVAEIDFSSMFPWLIFNHNISAETILSDKGPFDKVPGIPVRVSLQHKGFVPLAIKPLLDRRMEYKKNPTRVNKERAVGLKWVLVTSYGYLRFREFKLGVASSHMAICAYAREVLLKAAKLAEDRGFEIVHGIIDSLYIKKKGVQADEVKEFCEELHQITGIPISFEGIFKWICFLPSVNDNYRPVPTRFYGIFDNGDVKARGIEVRQRSCPLIVKYFQQKVLENMAGCGNEEEIKQMIPAFYRMLRNTVDRLEELDADWLASSVCAATSDYKHEISQKKAVRELKKKGIRVMPGQKISYIYGKHGIVLPEDYDMNPDVMQYRRLLIRALYSVLQVFGITKEEIREGIMDEMQTRIMCIPMRKDFKNRRGLSEKELRRRLERHGWLVWRGDMLAAIRTRELYPNVERKYKMLTDLLERHHPGRLEELQYICAVHHGMPDFLCYRDCRFKFVECKLEYEPLSDAQKRCIRRLEGMGFGVEIHKLVQKTRMNEAVYVGDEKVIIEKQLPLRTFA